MKKYLLIVATLLISTTAMAQKVTNVNFVRIGKELTITYSLDRTADIRVRVSIDGGNFYSRPLQNLSGDVGFGSNLNRMVPSSENILRNMSGS